MISSRRVVGEALSHKWIGLLLLSGILMVSMVIPPFRDQKFTACLFENIFGIRCPGCGMTRAFLFIGHGDIRSALEMNINSLAVYALMVVCWMQFAFNVVTGKAIRFHFSARRESI